MLLQDVEEVVGDLSVKVKFSFIGEYTIVIHVIFELRPVLIIEGLKHMVHKFLHHGRAVSRSKWHYYRGVEPLGSLKCQDILGSFLNYNIVVAFT